MVWSRRWLLIGYSPIHLLPKLVAGCSTMDAVRAALAAEVAAETQQVCVNPTQVCVNLTQVRVNLTQACVKTLLRRRTRRSTRRSRSSWRSWSPRTCLSRWCRSRGGRTTACRCWSCCRRGRSRRTCCRCSPPASDTSQPSQSNPSRAYSLLVVTRRATRPNAQLRRSLNEETVCALLFRWFQKHPLTLVCSRR
jgi:hypothetical protein